MSAVRDAGLIYVGLGLRVIPVNPADKYPTGIGGWQHLATRDRETVRRWWEGRYRNWGIGIVGGRMPDGRFLVILDVDVKDEKCGDETLADLEAEYGTLPATVTTHSPSGGWHLFFLSPVEIRNDAGKRLGPGLDIRGEGGFVVAPPTRIPDGRCYVTDLERGFDTAIADAPTWLVDLLTYQPTSDRDTAANSTSPGRRRINLTHPIAGLIQSDGWTLVSQSADGASYWRRPGKNRGSCSASLDKVDAGILNVFSTNANVPQGGYDSFRYLKETRFGGDWRATYDGLDPLRAHARRITRVIVELEYDDWSVERIDTSTIDSWIEAGAGENLRDRR